jgi:hypothetical protein
LPEASEKEWSFFAPNISYLVVYFGEPNDHYVIEVKSTSLARALEIMFNNAWKNTE